MPLVVWTQLVPIQSGKLRKELSGWKSTYLPRNEK